jgi:multiple antibiotic resistance protein
MIAGGALLFAFSVRDLLAPGASAQAADRETFGAVPLGVPLLAGPAVLTTCMLLVDQYGTALTSLAVAANMGLAAVVLAFADRIHRALGSSGTRIVHRVTLLLLASIAVMTVRRGLELFLRGAG